MSGQFTGWRPERAGWIFGLTTWQLGAVSLACAVPLLALMQQRYAAILPSALLAAAVIAVVVPSPGGRPVGAWMGAWMTFRAGEVMGWNLWVSRSSRGEQVRAGDPADLPGALARLRFHAGPLLPGHGAVCLVHDPSDRTWSAVARVTHPGLALATPAAEEMFVGGWSRLLAAVAAEGGMVRRLSVLVRTVPDDGAESSSWIAENLDRSAPHAALATIAELMAVAAPAATRQEIYLTLVIDEGRARRAAKAAGGGVDGYGRVVARELAGLAVPLAEAGFGEVHWLDTYGVAAAVRAGFDPHESASLAEQRMAVSRPGYAGLPAGVPPALAGPAAAVNRAAVYEHDGAVSASFAVMLPDLPMRLDALAALLPPLLPGERRSLALHFEPIPPSKAVKAVNNEIYKTETLAETKRVKQFRVSSRERRALAEAQDQERQIADGHSLTRAAALLTVTVPATENIDDATAAASATARAHRLRLRRLWLTQDAGFYAGALPLGVGLRRLTGVAA